MAHVLVVDDEETVREALSIALSEEGHAVESVGTAADALAAATGERSDPFDVLLLDLRLPDRHGLEVLSELRSRKSSLPVIVISADTEMSSTVKAMRDGAHDYVTKPIDLDALERLIDGAVKRNATSVEGPLSAPAPALPTSSRGTELEGDSPAIREVFKALGLLAASRATVLLRGESGTGKELAARTLHEFSRTSADAPFVAVNCGALPGPLVEAELFGYKKGAFTGADRDRAGKLEAAGDGTLFLDEVGEIPLETQVKLLRVLQERRYERLGETDSRPFRARVIAATHRNLEAMVRSGRLREDLFFRLNVATVTLPPLRERREDIPLLARRLLGASSREIGRSVTGFAPGALDLLLSYDWPGNVRELRNALTRAAVRARADVILPEDLELGQAETASEGSASVEAAAARASGFPTLDDVEREHIRRALARARGHKGKACDLLGISRPTLARKIRRYSIDVREAGRLREVAT